MRLQDIDDYNEMMRSFVTLLNNGVSYTELHSLSVDECADLCMLISSNNKNKS